MFRANGGGILLRGGGCTFTSTIMAWEIQRRAIKQALEEDSRKGEREKGTKRGDPTDDEDSKACPVVGRWDEVQAKI